MFFSKKYQILIDKPCWEKWEGMTPTGNGRFCDSCSKKVIDYSILSDKQINEIIRKDDGNMCGRFRKDQLEKIYTLHPQIQLSSQRRFFQYILTLLFASKAFINKAIGQTDTLKMQQTDSLKLVSKDDSCITDTVAVAQKDTDNLQNIYCWDMNMCAPEIVLYDTLTVTMVFGGMGIVYKDSEPSVSFMPVIFDSIKNLFGIKKTAITEMTASHTNNNKPDKEPVKNKPVVSVAVLPEELKRRSERKS